MNTRPPQILYQLYLLLFYCRIISMSLSLSLLSHLQGVSVTEKHSLSLLPYQNGVFSVTNISFLNNFNKYNHTHSFNNPYENHTTDWRNSKIVFQRFLSFPQYPHLLYGLSSFSCNGYQGLFH